MAKRRQVPAAAGPTILLAENDPAAFDATARMLRAGGFEVLHATTAVDALDLVRGGRRIDLLLAAIRIEGQPSGFVLARMARLRRPDIAVAYFGEARDIPEREAERALGPILRRPFAADALAAAVRAAIHPGGD